MKKSMIQFKNIYFLSILLFLTNAIIVNQTVADSINPAAIHPATANALKTLDPSQDATTDFAAVQQDQSTPPATLQVTPSTDNSAVHDHKEIAGGNPCDAGWVVRRVRTLDSQYECVRITVAAQWTN